MTKCIYCAHFSLKKAGPIVKLGFGICDKETLTGTTQSAVYERKCKDFEEEIKNMEQRKKWMEGKND